MAFNRRNLVLNQMLACNFITEEEAAQAKQAPLDIVDRQSRSRKAPFFLISNTRINLQQKDCTEEDLYTQGYRIYTTLDLRMQELAEEAIADLPTGEPDKTNVTQPQVGHWWPLDPTNGRHQSHDWGRDWQNTAAQP